MVDCLPTGEDGHRLRLALDAAPSMALEGGHFFMLRTEQREFPFLSRPFSVHDVEGCVLDFVLKAVGPGTRCLAGSRPGERVHLTGPLGQPFPHGDPGTTTILVAGGVGFPPLHLYLRRRAASGRREPVVLLYGGRRNGHLYEVDSARSMGVTVHTATEDGSEGFHGRVDGLLERILNERASEAMRILTCGPDPMMERVAEIAAARSIPCLVSLETFMACGFGVCNVCAVPLRLRPGEAPRYARACIDGPVFNAARLWDHGVGGR